jgi:GxGYxYP putative glycoside hydrolase C-terminal domain
VVQFRIPVLWISSPADAAKNPQASFEEEKQLGKEVLMRMPPNIPAIGWPGNSPGREEGMGEWPGVRLLSECGKIEVCSGYDGYSPAVSNLSVHSGTKAVFKQTRTPSPALDSSKVYCVFIRSDGDGLNFQRHYYRKLFDDPTHGKVPLGWEIGPTAADFIPDILDYYYKHARPGDCFVNALSGVGYIHEDNFADNYPPEQREAIWRQFLELSGEYMERINARSLTTFAEMRPDLLQKLASLKPVRAVFANYGRTHATKQTNLLTFVDGKPVFRALNTAPATLCYTPSARANAEALIVEQVRRWTPVERPAFLYIFLANWLTDIDMAFNIARQLGPSYTFVTPDHLTELSEAAKRS